MYRYKSKYSLLVIAIDYYYNSSYNMGKSINKRSLYQ